LNTKRLRGCLGVFLVFVFGIIVGAVIGGAGVWHELQKIIERGPEAVVSKIAQRLKDELKLDEDQQKMIEQVATETQRKLRRIQARSQPEIDAVLAEAADEVRVILDSEQRKKFDRIIGRVQQRWRDKDAGPSEGHSPPEQPAPAPSPQVEPSTQSSDSD
jgi:predicted PurR-regulated permease PerM